MIKHCTTQKLGTAMLRMSFQFMTFFCKIFIGVGDFWNKSFTRLRCYRNTIELTLIYRSVQHHQIRFRSNTKIEYYFKSVEFSIYNSSVVVLNLSENIIEFSVTEVLEFRGSWKSNFNTVKLCWGTEPRKQP